jgi:nucleolar protein 12
MLPRRLRVMRAKAVKKRAERQRQGTRDKDARVDKSMQGRAAKLLGRAGAAQVRKGGGSKRAGGEQRGGEEPPQEEGKAVVFEGHRARPNDRAAGLKVGRKKKKGAKPSTRSTKRAAAWRKAQEGKPQEAKT